LHYASCLLVGFERQWLLIDCPHPIRKMLREATEKIGFSLDIDSIGHVVLTHLHADHCSGVEGFLFFHRYAVKQKPVLVGHESVMSKLWSGHLAAGMETSTDLSTGMERTRSLEEFASVVHIPTQGEVRVGPFSIACRTTMHTVPTTALRIRAGHRCLGYSSDTSFDPELIDWLAEADMFVHETNAGIHTEYEKLCNLPGNLREKMKIIHYPDSFRVDGAEIEPLREGGWYIV
ncbi:MAG TPA: MBL fold metallo-hydrolase, partial [Polyangiaceae bacterium]|nr:MBL fold metallo-hydrolase [Polyangiaceae bacterium]